jgi:hypothetical protein
MTQARQQAELARRIAADGDDASTQRYAVLLRAMAAEELMTLMPRRQAQLGGSWRTAIDTWWPHRDWSRAGLPAVAEDLLTTLARHPLAAVRRAARLDRHALRLRACWSVSSVGGWRDERGRIRPWWQCAWRGTGRVHRLRIGPT